MTVTDTSPVLRLAQVFTLASVLALATAVSPVHAQSTDEAEAEGVEAEADAAADDPAASVLSTGEPVPAPNQPPAVYVREEHGDWEVRCVEAPEGFDDACQLYQRLSDQQGNPTADINVFDLPDGGEIVAGAIVLTPLRTLLTAQVTISVDDGQPRRYPFSYCDPGGCYARIGFLAEDINRFRRGAEAKVVVVPEQAPDQQAILTMSLAGFTAGYEAVTAPNPE